MNKQIINKKKICNELLRGEEQFSNKLSNYRLLLLVMLILMLFMYFKTDFKTISLIILCLVVITFIVIALIHNKIDFNIKSIKIYLNIIKEYEDRVDGSWINFKDTGLEVSKETDLTKDFNLIGHSSLFQLLNVSKSIGGKKRFIELLTKPDTNTIKDRQESVTELKDNFTYILEIQKQLNLIDDIDKTDFKTYLDSLKEKITPKKEELVFGIIMALIADIIFIICLFNILPFQVFFLILLIQTLISYIYLYFHNETFENITTCSRKLSTLKELYKYLTSIEFTTNKLEKIRKDIVSGYDEILELSKINDLNNLRSNFITNVIFNTIMSLNITTNYKYACLLSRSKKIEISIHAIEELEGLLSLTTICLIKKETCLPTITDKTVISFENIKHPLLLEDKCVPNNFSSEDGINIITGTNMSGKTSFMRTIGVNLILMEAGTYVEATSFTSKVMKIFSSIKVEDDLNNNISTFYGELLRIQKIIEYAKTHNETLAVFIDEIFKGTNYNDRIYGAKEIIKKLNKLDCITFITTHDFELCELENKTINNYHFEENYKGTDILFDYKIKEGKCLTTNAKYLMEKLGIID